ncbi:MAG TPA: hypothetical protein VKA84_10425, partial [Gemmatimonadaceae bacterium]|nr:hypothetical protein [Gemmatimonadaceae bacterium]
GEGTELVSFESAGVRDLGGDPWAACNVRVAPGAYRLRLTIPGRGAIEQTVVASPGWQTQVFLLQRNYPTRLKRPSGGLGDGDAATRPPAADPEGRRADLAGASIFLAAGEGFSEQDPLKRQTELARLGLVGRRRVVADAVRAQLRDKAGSPMLGIFAAHLLLTEETRDDDLLRIVVGNLRAILGPHPDVEAIALEIGESALPSALTAPPMLRRSWSLWTKATVTHPELVPADSFCGEISEYIIRSDPWLLWRSSALAAARVDPDQRPTDLETLVGSYIRPRAARAFEAAPEPPGTSKMRGFAPGPAPGLAPGLAPDLGATSFAFDLSGEPGGGGGAAGDSWAPPDESQLSAMVQSLDVPRAQLEQLVEKVRRQSRPSP